MAAGGKVGWIRNGLDGGVVRLRGIRVSAAAMVCSNAYASRLARKNGARIMMILAIFDTVISYRYSPNYSMQKERANGR